MAKEKTDKCKHPACNCSVENGNEYCSLYCQSVGIDHPSDACECGHTECAVGEAVGAAG